MYYFWLVLSVVLILAGFAGIFVPFLPDSFLVFLGILAYGAGEGFEKINFVFLVWMAGLALLSPLLDWLGVVLGAKKAKASWVSIIIGIISGIIGLVIFSLPGFIIFSFLGVVLTELAISKRKLRQALSAGVGTLIGFLISSMVKVLIILVMVGLFLARIF